MIRVITIAREYGSGGARIGALVAERLGWRLLDKALIGEIARAAQVDSSVAQEHDERVDSWGYRLMKHGFTKGAFEGVGFATTADYFDCERMAILARQVITEAATIGNCVIVGRGGQCILQERDDALHVFVYAPWRERITRARAAFGDDRDIEADIREVDQQRAAFTRRYFHQDRQDPHLYDLMISSTLGEETVASTILSAAGLAAASARPAGSA